MNNHKCGWGLCTPASEHLLDMPNGRMSESDWLELTLVIPGLSDNQQYRPGGRIMCDQ